MELDCLMDPLPDETESGARKNEECTAKLQDDDLPWALLMTETHQLMNAPFHGDCDGSPKVCIIDTGIDTTHSGFPSYLDIGGKAIRGGYWDEDRKGHGTHVAGIIAARPDDFNKVVGLLSASENPHLIIMKVFDDNGKTSLSSIVQGFDDCLASGARVIYFSAGKPTYSEIFESLIEKIHASGKIVVAAGGNDGSGISVAAVDCNYDIASFSQQNDSVDLSAPGDHILSTGLNGGYRTWSGTSMAAPYVAAIAALLWSHFPSCTNQQLRETLESTALKLTGSEYGKGKAQSNFAYHELEKKCGTMSSSHKTWTNSHNELSNVISHSSSGVSTESSSIRYSNSMGVNFSNPFHFEVLPVPAPVHRKWTCLH